MVERDNHRFRLIALDLDGTVVPPGQPISARVRRAVAAVQERGIYVALASGRRFSGALPFARELDLTGPLICLGGAIIKDPATGKVIYQRCVPLALAHEVILAGRELRLPVNVYLDDDIYVDELSPAMPAYAALVRMRARPVGDLLSFLDRDPTYLALVCDAAETKRRVVDLRSRFGDRLYVTSGHPLLAEVSHPEVSKGKALARLAELLGVRREEVVAVGNDWNDLDMIAYAGLGVAMAGSPRELLAAADRVAPAAQEDGVAVILEELLSI